MQFFSFAFAAVMLAAYMPVPGIADIIAFSGTQCSGAAGANVACDGSCVAFSGRESFEVTASGLHCVTFYEGSNCAGLVATFPNQGDSRCSTVTTGTATNSFRCSSTDTCSN